MAILVATSATASGVVETASEITATTARTITRAKNPVAANPAADYGGAIMHHNEPGQKPGFVVCNPARYASPGFIYSLAISARSA